MKYSEGQVKEIMSNLRQPSYCRKRYCFIFLKIRVMWYLWDIAG